MFPELTWWLTSRAVLPYGQAISVEMLVMADMQVNKCAGPSPKDGMQRYDKNCDVS